MESLISSANLIRLSVAAVFLAAIAPLRGDQVEAQVEQVQVQVAELIEEVAEVAVAAKPAYVKADAEKADPEESIEAQFPRGAGLKTDPELETYLKRAEKFVEEGRYDLAAILWQRVLNESGETVMTRTGIGWTSTSFDRKYQKYKSVTEEIERTIAQLPDIGLRQYRLSADGEAHAILAAGQGDAREQSLADVVRLYFMSSLGDDAAFELACLRLDRHDFVGGARLLSRVLNDYPDPSISRSELLLRLALANARLGDAPAALGTLDVLKQSSDASAFERVASVIRNDIQSGAASAEELRDEDAWHMAWGGPRRHGFMPSLPETVVADTLSEAWFENFEIESDGFLGSTQQMQNSIVLHGGMFMGRSAYGGRVPTNSVAMSRDQMLAKWRSSGWMPTGQMLLSDGLVYYKKHNRIVCRDAASGKLKWMSRPSIYQPPALSAWLLQMQRSYGMNASNTQPSGPLESFLFGDRLHQAMTISEDVLFTIDGPLEGEPVPARTNVQQGFNYRSIPRRTRTNFLCAYDAQNGKFKWMRSADGSADGSQFDVGFMAAPVPHAKFLLVPVSDNGALWLHALEKSNGALAWKTFLCEDPMSGGSPWSPVGLSVDGGDAYVATGGGVVVAVDAMTGAVRWAVRYQRSTKSSMNMARFNMPQQSLQGMDGWEEDVAIPHGRALVVMASDSDKLFALDRRSGQLIWESPRQPTGDDDAGVYCLGVMDDGLFLAGRTSLRRYDLDKDGRFMWEARFGERSFGHGVLTSDAIYMPSGDTIAKVDAKTGKIEAQVKVFSPTKEPVGNLFSDGERLLSIGMARAYALQDLTTRMVSLKKRIAEGDSEAQLERMRLHLRGDKFDDALSDLRDAHKLRLAQQGGVAANMMLYEGMSELDLIQRDPRLSMSLIVDAQAHVADASEQSNVSDDDLKQLTTKRDGLIFAALNKVRKDEISGIAQEVLDIAAIAGTPNLVNTARRAMKVTAAEGDADRLREALTSENANVRVVAIAGVEEVFGEGGQEPLAALLKDKDDNVRLTAAIALANVGQREVLTTMGELLEADDVQIRSRSVQALRAMTGRRFKFMAYEKPEIRAAAAKAWRDWIASDGRTAELKLPIGDSNVLLGRTLVAMYSQNRIVEYDADHKKIWEKTGINQPWGADGLPNGNRLICSYNGKFVVELDDQGKEVWRIDNLPGYGSHAHRLDNGNTLVACANANQVIEYSPDKKVVWKKQVVGNPQDARRLDSGNTLVALQSGSKVVEIDEEGKVVWEMTGMQGAFAARRLDNGNTLVALSGAGKVVEITPDKKTIWEQSGLSSPYDAQRLDNGNTLIVDTRGFREVDPDGKIVWQETINGALRIHRF